MRFYNNQHNYYCGIDLHARLLYVCILDSLGNKVLHKKIDADPDALLELITPYQDNIVIGVECMHCWYWVSDLCLDYAFDFVLGHALYMKVFTVVKRKTIVSILSKLRHCFVAVISLSPMFTLEPCEQHEICYDEEPKSCAMGLTSKPT